MKKLFFLLFLIAISSSFGQDFKLMTYNLRYENNIDGANSWTNRRDFLISQIKYYEPDIFGTQEGICNQIKWLHQNLENYDFVGIGREEGTENDRGEFAAIYYNKVKFIVVKSGTFWLSETPSKPTKGWDAAQCRICTYALFKDKKNKQQFYLFNTHFDHKGNIAREKSAELILSQIHSVNQKNYPVVLTGDFNLTPDQSPIIRISKELNDSRTISQSKPFGPEETFCDFDVCKPPQKRIDYIFTSKNNILVKKYAAIVDVLNMHYASDHYPILINISFTK
jgi:endonuclease/exonuclease/phosphatase family metal-dependent hydrolase